MISGTITIGDDTFFAHSCLVLTTVYRFYNGKRANLRKNPPFKETPGEKRYYNRSRSFYWSGCYLLARVSIGDNTIAGAASVVTKNILSSCFACGSPAKVVKHH